MNEFPDLDPRPIDPSADPFSKSNIPSTTALLWLKNIGKPQKEINRTLSLCHLAQIISDDANGLAISTDVIAIALNSLGYTIDVSGGSSPLDWFTNATAWANKGLKACLEQKQKVQRGYYNHTRGIGKRHYKQRGGRLSHYRT